MPRAPLALLLLLLLLAGPALPLDIFGVPDSFCGADQHCPTFGRTRCVGTNFGLIQASPDICKHYKNVQFCKFLMEREIVLLAM